MGQLTERGKLVKSDASEPADVAVYNANMDQTEAEIMGVPFVTSVPSAADSWPGKFVLMDSGDPALFLPDVRISKADTFWHRANSGSWESYTPDMTGVTLGNGTRLGRYVQIGTVLYCEILLILGSTSAITGSMGFGTPNSFKLRIPPDSDDLRAGVGHWMARVAGNLWKGRVIRRSTPTTVDLEPLTNSATTALTLNATRPGTWANGDKLFIQVMAEAERV